MKDEQLTDRIDAFLTGSLDRQSEQTFRQEMNKSQELATEVELRRLMHESADLLLEKELRAKMRQWELQPTQTVAGPPVTVPVVSQKLIRSATLVAAGTVVIAVAIWRFSRSDAPTPAYVPPTTPVIRQPEQPAPEMKPEQPIAQVPLPTQTEKKSPQQKKTTRQKEVVPTIEGRQTNNASTDMYAALAIEEYQPAAAYETRKKASDDDPKPSVLENATEAFNRKDYAQTIALLEKEASTTRINELRAHSYFGLRNYAKAGELFGALKQSSRIGPDAEWNQVLCALAVYKQQPELFINIIRPYLQNKEHSRHKDAVRLMEKSGIGLD